MCKMYVKRCFYNSYKNGGFPGQPRNNGGAMGGQVPAGSVRTADISSAGK